MTLLGRSRSLFGLMLGLLVATFAVAEDAKTPPASRQKLPADADAAWTEVVKATKPPEPPAEWNQKPPSEEAYKAFRLKMGEAAAAAADLAGEFQVRWPNHAKAADAKKEQIRMLTAAVQLGVASREKERQEVAAAGRSDKAPAEAGAAAPKADSATVPDASSKREQFTARFKQAIEQARGFEKDGIQAILNSYYGSLLKLRKEFGDQPEIFGGFYEIAMIGEDSKRSLELVKEIAASPAAPERVKAAAATLKESLERIGKPVDIQFAAVDGTQVNLSKMKGKVVLVDFWATWCGPCVKEVPNVKATYDKWHAKGFEIVGISFDQDKEALLSFTKRNQMTWAQYFDGEGWGNKFGKQFGISGIPAMWLIDKQGNLRDSNARANLAEKVEKLLAEN